MITIKKPLWLIVIVILIVLFIGRDCRKEYSVPNISAIDSDTLQSTTIVPTLDSPMPSNTNVIWCSSFQYGWNELKNEVIKEDVIVGGAEQLTNQLNNAKQSLSDSDRDSCYAKAGVVSEGVLNTIQTEMKRLFPDESPPQFGPVLSDSIVAYAFLAANVKFTIPYFENRARLAFIDSNGNRANVSSFGIREKDDYAYFKLREQVGVLFGGLGCKEYAIDLCKSSQSCQIIVALIKPEETLDLTMKSLEKKISENAQKGEDFHKFGPNDVLLVPNILFKITHHFRELEGKTIQNKGFKGYPISEATQVIQFKLDRSGAELKSESKILILPIPMHYVFDKPFLVYMKTRGAKQPFFVMWVDNTELLDKF